MFSLVPPSPGGSGEAPDSRFLQQLRVRARSEWGSIIHLVCNSMLRNTASDPEVALADRMLAAVLPGINEISRPADLRRAGGET